MSLTKVTYAMVDGAFANAKDFGASPSASAATNTTAFQLATAYAASLGLTLVVPEGTYLLTPSKTVSALSTTKYCVFSTVSNLHIVGLGDVTLKVADGFSTTAAPKDYFIALSVTDDTNVSFENIVFDMNGHNNLIAVKPVVPAPPTAPGVDWGVLLTSAIAWITDSATPTVGKVDGLRITGCTFTGTPGTNNIVLGTALGNPFPTNVLSNNVVIENCTFLDSGFNTSDFTSIYGYAENMLVDGCKFTVAASRDNIMTGTAVEIHGAFSTVRNCEVYGLVSGVMICDNYVSNVYAISVYGNYIEASTVPIGFFRIANVAVPTALYGVSIFNNVIRLVPGVALSNLAYGIGMYTVDRTVRDVQIYNNSVTNLKGNSLDVQGIFCGTYNPLESFIFDRIYITNNGVYDFTVGIEFFIGTGGTGHADVGSIYINDNNITGIVQTTGLSRGHGIFIYDTTAVLSTFTYLQITGNHVQSTDIGIYLNGADITNYDVQDNVLECLSANAYFEQTTIVTQRFGFKSAISYDSAAPTTGIWRVGDIVYNTAPASAGYVGWVCTVAGTPGTWKTFGLIS